MFFKEAPGPSRSNSLPALAALLPILIFTAPAGANDAAHAIAQKFSGSAEKKAKSDAAAKAAQARRQEAQARAAEAARREAAAERARLEEEEMLARARAEAAQREAAARKEREEKTRAEAERKAAELARIEAQRQAEAAEARRKDEARKQEAARLARQAEEEKAQRIAADEARKKQAEADQRQALEALREREARQLAEKHNRVRLQREQAVREAAPTESEQPPALPLPRHAGKPSDEVPFAAPHALGAPLASVQTPAWVVPSVKDDVVTVLLLMKPGNRGIRRYGKTADPVLCMGRSCYIGNGAAKPALKVWRHVALGPANTLGRRAGACRHSLGCVFRAVDFASVTQLIQPIDLRIMRHDRRQSALAHADASCTISRGRLSCANPVRSSTWRAWIVPERVAVAAGEEVLNAALRSGLPDVVAAKQ